MTLKQYARINSELILSQIRSFSKRQSFSQLFIANLKYFFMHRTSCLSCYFIQFTLILSCCIIFSDIINEVKPENLISPGVVDYISENLRYNPIQEITIVDEFENCPFGYMDESLGDWPGSYEGCKIKNERTRRKCQRYNVKARPTMPIYIWRHKRICIKRITNVLYNFEGYCPLDYKSCGNDLCVPDEISCPITKIQRIFHEPGLDQEAIPFLSNDSYLIISRIIGDEPVVLIEYSPLGLPCLARGYTLPRPEVHLLIKSYSGCGVYGPDQRADLLDYMDEIDLYVENNLVSVLAIPDYNQTIEECPVYLVTRKRVSVSLTQICHYPPTRRDYLTKISWVLDWEFEVKSLIYLEVALFILLILSFYEMISLDRQRDRFRATIVFCLMIFFEITYLAVTMIDLTDHTQELMVAEETYKLFSSNNCVLDDVLAQALSDFLIFTKETPQWINKIYAAALILKGCQVLLMFAFAIFRVIKPPPILDEDLSEIEMMEKLQAN